MLKTIFLIISICWFVPNVGLGQIKNSNSNTTPAWVENACIYEVNIRQYTPEGTFKSFEKHLDRLQDLGVKILWFMPIQPIGQKNRKGTMGSYYSVQDYTKVNPEFGTLKDFQNLVRKCHQMGFKVIIDWVANHSSPDNPWVTAHPEWYFFDSTGKVQPPSGTDWWDVAKLNYTKPALHTEMIKSMNYWIKKCDIDGFRCDVAGDVPIDFWNKASQVLRAKKPIFMLAEWENPNAFSAFNADYGWELHHLLAKIASGEKKLTDIDTYLTNNSAKNPKNAIHMYFVTNHDENSWNGTIKEKFGPLGDAFTAFTMIWNGIPLIYSGQEADLQRRLPFFEKDNIDWSILSKQDLLKKLIILKKQNQALVNGENGAIPKRILTRTDEATYAFKRTKEKDEVVFIMNISPNKTLVKLKSNFVSTSYTNVLSGEKVQLNLNENEFTLPGFGFLILECHE